MAISGVGGDDPRPGRRSRSCDQGVRPWRVLLGLLTVGALLTPIGSAWAAGSGGSRQDPGRNPSPLPIGSTPVATAEVSFDVPRWFATVMDPSTTRLRLYGVGDVLADPKGVGEGYRIRRIEEHGLQLGDRPGHKAIWIHSGSLIPGRPGWRLTGTLCLRVVEYRYVPTGGPLDAEPRVLELRGDHAALEVDISTSAPASLVSPSQRREVDLSSAGRATVGTGFEHTLLGRVRVTPTAEHSQPDQRSGPQRGTGARRPVLGGDLAQDLAERFVRGRGQFRRPVSDGRRDAGPSWISGHEPETGGTRRPRCRRRRSSACTVSP